MDSQSHKWSGNADTCSCGQDTVVCQGCGRLTCGNLAIWREGSAHPSHAGRVENGGNIGPCCFAKFGMGHMGTPPVKTPILVNAATMASQHPGTFARPSAAEIATIKPGCFVKVCADAERFWSEVVDRDGDTFVGRVDNDLVVTRQLGFGDRFAFHADNIYNAVTAEGKGIA